MCTWAVRTGKVKWLTISYNGERYTKIFAYRASSSRGIPLTFKHHRPLKTERIQTTFPWGHGLGLRLGLFEFIMLCPWSSSHCLILEPVEEGIFVHRNETRRNDTFTMGFMSHPTLIVRFPSQPGFPCVPAAKRRPKPWRTRCRGRSNRSRSRWERRAT